MEVIEVKESLKSEYDRLICELNELGRLYKDIKKKHGEMELKDLELCDELEELSNKLKGDTKIDEENEKCYIESNCNKLKVKLSFICGLFLYLFMIIMSLLTGKLVLKPVLTIGLIMGNLSFGVILGLGIFVLYSKKYQSILKERYKQTDIHKKHSYEHYDKMIKLIGKKERYNKYNQEYLKVKDEYITLERNFFSKIEELKLFKEKVFEMIFQSYKEEIDKFEEILINEDNGYCDNCSYKEVENYRKTLKKN